MPVYVAGIVISNEAAAALAVASPYAVVAGTSAVHTLTVGGAPTAGAASTFRISFDGYTTAPIAWSATNATLVSRVDAALEALSSVGTGGVTTAVGTMTAGVGTITITAAGGIAARVVPEMAVAANSLTGAAPTVAIALTTPGVDPTVELA